ncbi:MAG: molybdate ABC transporter substrate-binding protein [Chloroflexi bacterium RBG_16_72_14]|nr:MAG: molybdate ABC transporter substrate-binding protein [Chloroflexi bacterium RBG_16_72_14]
MSNRRRPLLGIALVVAACLPAGPATGAPSLHASGTSGASGTTVRVAVAADLRFAMDELVAAWATARPATTVTPVYGSSGTFFAQLSQDAPFDVFFSADADYPHELELAGLAEPGATRLYAIGQIVVWVRSTSTLDVAARGLAALADPSVETIAIANPEHAPYGRSAMAALDAAGILEAVEPKLVLGENVSQAAQFVESGGADAGIIALSLALAPTMREAGRHAVVPIDTYPRLEQGAVVLRAAADPAAAGAFLDFVLGAEGRAVLDRYGFLLPDA